MMNPMPAGPTGRPRFLASVTSALEAQTAIAAGAEIIDAKNPAEGALGALPHKTVRGIVEAVARAAPVSATVGDLVPEPDVLCRAAVAMAGTRVDLVKIGFFTGGDPVESIRALGRLDLHRTRLVGLLLADRDPDFNLIGEMARAGFAGVMLDTASKRGGTLTDMIAPVRLGEFVAIGHDAGLFVGLAGALRPAHIAPLAALGPDVLGFRGALCAGQRREGPLEGDVVRAVARTLSDCGRHLPTRHAALEAAP
jgi:uncharacterized protein (UPF0264 family)